MQVKSTNCLSFPSSAYKCFITEHPSLATSYDLRGDILSLLLMNKWGKEGACFFPSPLAPLSAMQHATCNIHSPLSSPALQLLHPSTGPTSRKNLCSTLADSWRFKLSPVYALESLKSHIIRWRSAPDYDGEEEEEEEEERRRGRRGGRQMDHWTAAWVIQVTGAEVSLHLPLVTLVQRKQPLHCQVSCHNGQVAKKEVERRREERKRGSGRSCKFLGTGLALGRACL